jgi:hypothetical protein
MPETDREDGLVSSTSTCHWMPCSISYDGVAPIQMLFNPELVHTNDNQNLHQQAEEEKNDLISSYQQAASFRGRGLLAQGAYELPEGIVGSVLIPSEVDKSRLHQGESFREVLEWEHESDSKRLVKKCEGDEREVHNESSVEKGLALMDLLRAVHEPIPIKE